MKRSSTFINKNLVQLEKVMDEWRDLGAADTKAQIDEFLEWMDLGDAGVG